MFKPPPQKGQAPPTRTNGASVPGDVAAVQREWAFSLSVLRGGNSSCRPSSRTHLLLALGQHEALKHGHGNRGPPSPIATSTAMFPSVTDVSPVSRAVSYGRCRGFGSTTPRTSSVSQFPKEGPSGPPHRRQEKCRQTHTHPQALTFVSKGISRTFIRHRRS